MEEENIVNTEKQSSIIPALALLGLGLGAVAFALGIMAMVKVGDTAKDMNDKIEKAASVSLETKKMSDRIDSLAMQIDEVKSAEKNRTSTMVSQINEEFKRIYANINDTRKSVSETREIIEKLATRPTTAQPRKVTQAEAEKVKAEANAQLDAAEKSEQKASADAKKHVIQNGDTFAKLAKKYGVSVNAIVKANPDANPSRLKIGQEIIIP